MYAYYDNTATTTTTFSSSTFAYTTCVYASGKFYTYFTVLIKIYAYYNAIATTATTTTTTTFAFAVYPSCTSSI
jgi:hypothetical protein